MSDGRCPLCSIHLALDRSFPHSESVQGGRASAEP